MMETRKHAQSKAALMPSFTPVGGGVLQRKCACGGSAGLSGDCEGCSKQNLSLQHATENSELGTRNQVSVAPIVNEVLRAPGQSLDAETRTFMEPRFGHDFSRVRVHSDTLAAESARALNASAYTVGRDVVFGSGQYAPDVKRGRKLLAHELAHVVQQAPASASGPLETAKANTAVAEREADAAATHVLSGNPGTVSIRPQTSFKLARQEDQTAPASDQAGTQGSTEAPEASTKQGQIPCKPTFKSLEAVTACNIGMRVGDRGCELSLGTPADAGMKFHSQVESPEGCHGTLEYVQLVDFRRERRDKDNQTGCMQGTGALDRRDPKATLFTGPGTDNFESADNPGSLVGDDVYHSADDQFKLWLLWRPRILGAPVDAPELPRVALATVTWDWKAKTTRTGKSGDCQADWTISDDYARGEPGKATSGNDIPTYSQNVAERGFSTGPC